MQALNKNKKFARPFLLIIKEKKNYEFLKLILN